MKFSIIILFFISIHGLGQVKFEGYTSYFNLKTNIPDSVIWTITKAHLQGHKSPRVNKFHSSEGRQNLKRDYHNSGYDQGHNSPYDDNYYSDKVEFECFDYVNMFPQLHILNGGVWEKLEDHCRKLAIQYGECKVKTSWEGIDKKIGIDSVVVPVYCIKEIWFNGTYERYKMPNKDTVKLHDFTYYKF